MSDTLAAPSISLAWESLSQDRLETDAHGRLVDFLNPSRTRADTPEERVRQRYVRVLCEDYSYPPDCIHLEAPINIGHETRFADIAVYRTAAACLARDQSGILLIVETKAPDQSQGLAELKSYIGASSAEGGVWFNGKEDRIAYYRRDAVTRRLIEAANIPRFGESWDRIGHDRKQDLRPPNDLKQVFRRCHNAIYRTGADSEDVAMDMVRIILAKYRDEEREGELCRFCCTNEEYASAEGRRAVADRVRGLFAEVVEAHPSVFPPDEKITIADEPLAKVVRELQRFRFLADTETEQVYDIIGTAFEVYVAAHLKGARGQYFTNRLVVNLMVEILDPSESDIVLDPASGSGGFLIACLRYIRSKINHSARSEAAKRRALRSASERLYGIDISPKLVRVAKTNMILNGDGHGGIVHGNTLQDLADLPFGFKFRRDGTQAPVQATRILTNPPFGASHDLRVKEAHILAGFLLGHQWTQDRTGWLRPTDELCTEGVPPETLFLERCVELLAPGGRLAIVIARGLLDNRDALAARQYLLRNTRLLAVINCHPNTFAPFNGTKAAILVVEKKRNPSIQQGEDYPVFMAISQRVGQDSLGREIYQKDENGNVRQKNGQPLIDHDLGEILEAWRAFGRGETSQYEGAWSVPLKRIIDSPEMRFNPLRYAPAAEQALGEVLELADSAEWSVERLGDFATVFNGPRFTRPFAPEGVTSGEGIVPQYTPKSFFEERGESVKYLDKRTTKRTLQKQLETLTLQRDWILIVDSGTAGKLLGRVGMTTSAHEGAIGNNNMIRVVIEDPEKRDYVYQFLRSELGQALILRNVYGTNQDHIEPRDVKDIPIPFPRDPKWLRVISQRVRAEVRLRERVSELNLLARQEFDILLERAMGQSRGEIVLPRDSPTGFPDDDLEMMRNRIAVLLENPDLQRRLTAAFEAETEADSEQ